MALLFCEVCCLEWGLEQIALRDPEDCQCRVRHLLRPLPVEKSDSLEEAVEKGREMSIIIEHIQSSSQRFHLHHSLLFAFLTSGSWF